MFPREILEELVSELQCYTCQDLPGPFAKDDSRRYRCDQDEQHAVCKSCLTDDKCPCGGSVGKSHCKLTEKLVKELPWYCHNFKNGCKEIFHEEETLKAHQEECIFRMVHCFSTKCCKQVKFKDFLDHLNECKFLSNGLQQFEVANGEIIISDKILSLLAKNVPMRIDCFGEIFFLMSAFQCDVDFGIWLLMLTDSPARVKSYKCSLTFYAGDEEYIYNGKVLPIGEDQNLVAKRRAGLSLSLVKLKEMASSKAAIRFHIQNLKEESKDVDAESGVSDVSENEQATNDEPLAFGKISENAFGFVPENGTSNNVHGPDFKPIIPLPELVATKTGEEDEDVVFNHRAKVYRFDKDAKEWKEKGVGDIKILHHAAKNTFRILLRRDQVHKVACNHYINLEQKLEPMLKTPTALSWFAMDFSEDKVQFEKLVVRFNTVKAKDEFKKVFEESQEKLKHSKNIESMKKDSKNPDDASAVSNAPVKEETTKDEE